MKMYGRSKKVSIITHIYIYILVIFGCSYMYVNVCMNARAVVKDLSKLSKNNSKNIIVLTWIYVSFTSKCFRDMKKSEKNDEYGKL